MEQIALSERMTRFFEQQEDHFALDVASLRRPEFQEHFSRSQEAIAAAIDGVKNQTALVVGTTTAFAAPLQLLANRFDSVVIVDMDLRHARRGVKSLPESLRTKFLFQQVDLTGLLGHLDSQMEQLIEEHPLFPEFVSRVLDSLPSLRTRDFDYQKRHYDFVCSSLVPSLLVAKIVCYLNKISAEFWGQDFIIPPDRREEFGDWMHQVHKHHLEELHRLVDREGVVYFADYGSAKVTTRLRIPHVCVKEDVAEKQLFPWKRKVQELLPKLFTTIQKNRWTWTLLTEGWRHIPVTNGAQNFLLSCPQLQLTEHHVTSRELRPIQGSVLPLQNAKKLCGVTRGGLGDDLQGEPLE